MEDEHDEIVGDLGLGEKYDDGLGGVANPDDDEDDEDEKELSDEI